MAKQYFKSAEEITKPENINKVLKDNYDYTDQKVESVKGVFNKKTTVVSAGNIPSDLSDGNFAVEFNDTNKRLLFNVGGKVYKADLAEVT